MINQVLLFLIAGRETTAMTFACTLAQLALEPQWQTRVREEITELLGSRAPSGDDVQPAAAHEKWSQTTSMGANLRRL